MGRSQRKILMLSLLGVLAVCVYWGDFFKMNTPYASKDMMDLQGNDVIVVLPIYRTGMTSLMDHVVRDVTGGLKCSCRALKTRCDCRNSAGQPWVFNSHTATGHPCGATADLTTLTSCGVDQWMTTSGEDTRDVRRYHLVTMLRDPITRYISEWLHTRTRDWTYYNEPRLWRKESPELQKKEVKCLVGKKLKTLSLTDFINCKDNPANNRQVMTLANKTGDDHVVSGGDMNSQWLRSAEYVINQIPYFGMLSALGDSQALLHKQFGIEVTNAMEIMPTKSDHILRSLSPNTIRQIAKVNSLDVALYRYATRIFSNRFESTMGYEVTQMPVPAYYKDDNRLNNKHRDQLVDFSSESMNKRFRGDDVFRIEDFLRKEEMRKGEGDDNGADENGDVSMEVGDDDGNDDEGVYDLESVKEKKNDNKESGDIHEINELRVGNKRDAESDKDDGDYDDIDDEDDDVDSEDTEEDELTKEINENKMDKTAHWKDNRPPQQETESNTERVDKVTVRKLKKEINKYVGSKADVSKFLSQIENVKVVQRQKRDVSNARNSGLSQNSPLSVRGNSINKKLKKSKTQSGPPKIQAVNANVLGPNGQIAQPDKSLKQTLKEAKEKKLQKEMAKIKTQMERAIQSRNKINLY